MVSAPAASDSARAIPFVGGEEESLRGEVHRLLGRLFPKELITERRQDGRFPFPFLVRLTPVGDRHLTPVAESMVVVGKDLSAHGMGLFHPHPLPYRRAVVSLEDRTGRCVTLLIDLSWCRFTRHGWYESGGRFLQVVSELAVEKG